MSFINKSIEDSLKILNEKSDVTPKKRGRPRKKPNIPVPTPTKPASPVDNFSPYRTATAKAPAEPITLQSSPSKERIVVPVTPVSGKSTEEEPVDTVATCDVTDELIAKHFISATESAFSGTPTRSDYWSVLFFVPYSMRRL